MMVISGGIWEGIRRFCGACLFRVFQKNRKAEQVAAADPLVTDMCGKLMDQKPSKAAFGQSSGEVRSDPFGQLVKRAPPVRDSANDAAPLYRTEKSDRPDIPAGIGVFDYVVQGLGSYDPEAVDLYGAFSGLIQKTIKGDQEVSDRLRCRRTSSPKGC